MLIDKSKIKYYIPHRDPFIMIDSLEKANEEFYESKFEVKPDNVFTEDNLLREFALVENICQTAAAGLSYTQRNSNKSFKDGFLGSMTKLIVHDLPEVGAIIETKVIKKHQLGNLYLMHGETYSNGKLLIECEVKLAGRQD